MGRTTIEVEESVRNRLRTYKQSQGMTYNGALTRLLTTAGEPPEDEQATTPLQDDTETIFYSDVETHDPTEMCTFHHGFLQSNAQPVVFGGSGDPELSVKDFRDTLETVTPFLTNGAKSGSFAIHRSGGTWFGYGLGSFYSALMTQHRQECGTAARPQQPETAVFLGRGDWGCVCIGLALTDTHTISNLTIQFVTDGMPLTQYPYATMAKQMGFDLSNAHDLASERVTIEALGDQPPREIVETIPGQAQRSGEARLKGVQIRNPFYNDPERLRARTDTTGGFETVTAYEYIPCRLVGPYTGDAPNEDDSLSVTLHRLSQLTTGVDLINVDCRTGIH